MSHKTSLDVPRGLRVFRWEEVSPAPCRRSGFPSGWEWRLATFQVWRAQALAWTEPVPVCLWGRGWAILRSKSPCSAPLSSRTDLSACLIHSKVLRTQGPSADPVSKIAPGGRGEGRWVRARLSSKEELKYLPSLPGDDARGRSGADTLLFLVPYQRVSDLGITVSKRNSAVACCHPL